MSSSRTPGRYNLHRLGWAAFEDLCMQVMREVLGETCSRFRPGYDGGRDGWFRGQASGHLLSQNHLHGEFVIQCKHTSSLQNALTVADLAKEKAKVATMAAKAPCHYILMTNRQVSAVSDDAIRSAFQTIGGVKSCLVFQETWIEDTIDANPRLLRLVPRLYGIGDLSQILAFTLAQQTAAMLEDLARSLRTFVPTDSYRRAEHALHHHGFVVLVGPPASGKSAIAANLCMVNLAQDPDVRVMRIEHADQFSSTWSPADRHTLYWVDDVFGETTLDDLRLREWSAALERVEAARKRDARIIFCTRDYILTAAQRKLKQSKADIINDARVRIDVTSLSVSEREAILYNHIKDGDIGKELKRQLKGRLTGLARLDAFSPELARRLGSARFHVGLKYTPDDLRAFFENPVQHFRDLIRGLSESEMAALAVCLLSGNDVPDPVPDDALSDTVLKTYSVSMREVREALEQLDGSFVKRVRQETKQSWQVHHPSMIEALQQELASKSSGLALYLQGARLPAILRDTTTLPPPSDSRLVFLPETVYESLCSRLCGAGARELENVGEYLADRASDELLRTIDVRHPNFLDQAVAIVPEPNGPEVSARLAVRLHKVAGGHLFRSGRQEIVKRTLLEAVEESGWLGFVWEEDLPAALPGFLEALIRAECEQEFPSMEKLYNWCAQDLSEVEHIESAMDILETQETRLLDALSRVTSTDKHAGAVRGVKAYYVDRLEERRERVEESRRERWERNYDDWKDRGGYLEHESGRFADVDE
jgi:hypothetical protein